MFSQEPSCLLSIWLSIADLDFLQLKKQNFIKSHTASPQHTDILPSRLNKQSKGNYIQQPSSCPQYDCQSSLNTKQTRQNLTNKSRHARPHCNSQLLTRFQINCQSNKTRTIEHPGSQNDWLLNIHSNYWLTGQNDKHKTKDSSKWQHKHIRLSIFF